MFVTRCFLSSSFVLIATDHECILAVALVANKGVCTNSDQCGGEFMVSNGDGQDRPHGQRVKLDYAACGISTGETEGTCGSISAALGELAGAVGGLIMKILIGLAAVMVLACFFCFFICRARK